MTVGAKLPWQLHLKMLLCTCRLPYHFSTSFRYYFSCFTFLSLLQCIPRESGANLHVSIATTRRGSFEVIHPLDALQCMGSRLVVYKLKHLKTDKKRAYPEIPNLDRHWFNLINFLLRPLDQHINDKQSF